MSASAKDNVNHPSHYNSGRIEVIEFIEDQGFGAGFCKGNAIKYIARAGKKNPDKEIEDLEKAKWYVTRAIEQLKAAKESRAPIKPDFMDSNWRIREQSMPPLPPRD